MAPVAENLKHTPPAPENWPLIRISRPPRISPAFVALFYLLHVTLTCYIVFLGFRRPHVWLAPAWWLSKATHGLVNLTLFSALTTSIILVGGFLICMGGLRPRDMGLKLRGLPAAFIITVAAWIMCQAVAFAKSHLTGSALGLNPEWSFENWRSSIGEWLGQLLGNALWEETAYRGFMLPQCILLLAVGPLVTRPGWRIAIGLIVSQALFAIMHAPINTLNNAASWMFSAQFASGLLLAGVYIRTGNLLLAIGLHTLMNNPAPVFSQRGELTGIVVAIAAVASVILGPSIMRSGGSRKAAPRVIE